MDTGTTIGEETTPSSPLRLVGIMMLISNLLSYLVLVRFAAVARQRPNKHKKHQAAGPLSDSQSVDCMLQASSSSIEILVMHSSEYRGSSHASSRGRKLAVVPQRTNSSKSRRSRTSSSSAFSTDEDAPSDEEMGGGGLGGCIHRANSWPSDEPQRDITG